MSADSADRSKRLSQLRRNNVEIIAGTIKSHNNYGSGVNYDELAKDAEKLIVEEAQSSDPTNQSYNRVLNNFKQLLSNPSSVFTDVTVAMQLCDGVIALEDIIYHNISDSPYEKVQPRCVIRSKMLNYLLAEKFDDKHARKLAISMEITCYNDTITYCINAATPYSRRWESPAFTGIYSQKCGNVLHNLDSTDLVCQEYGCNFLESLRDYSDFDEPFSSPLLLAENMCPNSTAKEKADIERRMCITVYVRTSASYKCPNCFVMDCTYIEKQKRALDEAADICCTCNNCGATFRGD